jgi:hypothetical protein
LNLIIWFVRPTMPSAFRDCDLLWIKPNNKSPRLNKAPPTVWLKMPVLFPRRIFWLITVLDLFLCFLSMANNNPLESCEFPSIMGWQKDWYAICTRRKAQ